MIAAGPSPTMSRTTPMHLSPWPLVAAVFNLEVLAGLRPGPTVTAKEARRIALAAQRKLARALAAQGVDRRVIAAYFHLRDDCHANARVTANLAALLPVPSPSRDDADPSPRRSLRTCVARAAHP